jgi:Cu/Ag efflux protein CusF
MGMGDVESHALPTTCGVVVVGGNLPIRLLSFTRGIALKHMDPHIEKESPRMRSFIRVCLASTVICVGAVSCTKDKGADKSMAAAKSEASPSTQPAKPIANDSAGAKPGLYAESIQTVTATVEEIDQGNRMVTLRGPDGNALGFQAGPEVRTLAQVKVGDKVNVHYREGLGIQVAKPGEPVNETVIAGGRAAPGERPAAAGVQRTTITATVESMDPAVPSVTLRGPAGNLRTFKVRDKSRLENVSVGDHVIFTYIEAMAVSVEPMK